MCEQLKEVQLKTVEGNSMDGMINYIRVPHYAVIGVRQWEYLFLPSSFHFYYCMLMAL
jgi:hypothetical protein